MPELPEVQTTATSLTPLLGKRVANITVYQPQLRWLIPDNITDLIGFRLEKVERRAKYLIITFQKGTNKNINTKKILLHLGMSGSLQQHPQGFEKRKHDHVIFDFNSEKKTESKQLHYHDPRRFGAVLWLDEYQSKLIDHLGVEPLEDDFDGQYLYNYIHNRKKAISRPIKDVIMEQQVVVGVGNIYATESL